MSDDVTDDPGASTGDGDGAASSRLTATRYADGHLSYPGHDRSPDGAVPTGEVDLTDRTATVVTWTTSTATPPGVRDPNHLAIVAFEIDDETVRVIGQLTAPVETGTEVQPVYVEQLRDPEAGIKHPDSQAFDGFRFEPID